MRLPTGEQYELSFSTPNHELSATITQVGAGIRGLQIDGIDIVTGMRLPCLGYELSGRAWDCSMWIRSHESA
ncbi:hypothetical protein ASD23_07895 [Agromyces sp. Root1464]|nr:hypothetical protein ASD23_07895 [Agromyces sp. Root1464]